MNCIIKHALDNVWCNPSQDRQFIIKPAPLQKTGSSVNSFFTMERNLTLPTRNEKYFLFQIGQLNPAFLGLLFDPSVFDTSFQRDRWIRISTCCNQKKAIIDIYTDIGLSIPKHDAYYTFTPERNLIIAIKENPIIPVNLNQQPVYIRFYSNAYFQSIRSDVNLNNIIVTGATIRVPDEILTWQSTYQSLNALPGHCSAFINGWLKEGISLLNTHVGDCIELVYDSSIKAIVTFFISSLPSFLSELDSRLKYLIHYPTPIYNEICYIDDIEIYVTDTLNSLSFTGLYYHRNAPVATRMVTHRDYSLPVSFVSHYANKLISLHVETPPVTSGLKILVFIRNSGYSRRLIHEANKIHELYKLPDYKLVQALVGINSTVPHWTASHLEASAYSSLMGASLSQLTLPNIKNAYGYNSLSEILGQTPAKTQIVSLRPTINLPCGLQINSTGYEYDEQGHLIGIAHHPNGEVYTALYDNTRLVEVISGNGTYTPSVKFGRNLVPIPIGSDYRIYRCHFIENELDNNWRDITDTTEYSVIDGLITLISDDTAYLMVRDNSTFLAYDLNIAPTDGNLRFSLSEYEQRTGFNNVTPTPINNEVLPVPMGKLDIFLNGKAMIESIDYFIIFPEVVVVNKEYLISPPNTNYQKVTIRFTGFCDQNLQRNIASDVGFIEHGFLSNNNRFDIRDDKVLRIVVDGSLLHRSDLLFSEEHSGVSTINAVNGKPYSISDIIVPLRDYPNQTMAAYQEAIVIDSAISSYLTDFLPQPPRPNVTAIENRYAIFSPFLCKIIYDVFTEHLDKTLFDSPLNDNDIINICNPYNDWLRFDPTQIQCRVDPRYVIIHPHNHYNALDVSAKQYQFIRRVAGLYCRGLVEISPFLSIIN
jgi:hypothetical protein